MTPTHTDPERDDPPADGEHASGAGAREDFEQLFRKHNDSLLRYVNARLNSWTESRDVVQQAYVRLLGLDQSKEVNDLCAYLYRTAVNIANDRLRERGVRQRAQHLVLFEQTARENPTPERWWIAAQERESMERAVTQLPPKCRMAFTLVELEDRPLEVVAEHMGIKVASVREFVRRAYAHLAKALAHPEDRRQQ